MAKFTDYPIHQLSSSVTPSAGKTLDWWILLSPAVALALFAAGNQDFGFDNPGLLDAFVYVGYFWHYPEHLPIFENYYKGSRLPWILPGFASFRLLGEIAGSYLLHWMTLAGGGVAIHLLIRDTLKDRLVAAVIAVAWVCSTTGHGPGGWNYHALAAAAYYLLACWLIVRTASGSSPRSGVLAGAAFACAVHTYIFYVSFIPLGLWLYLASRPHTGTREWKRFGVDVAWMSAGGLGITLVLAAINAASGGRWLFFMPQLQATIFLTQPGSDTWWSEGERWLPRALYLVIPILSLCAGTMSLLRSTSAGRLRMTFVLQGWAALGIFSYFQFVHHWSVLNYAYMAFGLNCHAFPALAVALQSVGDARSSKARIATLAGSVALILGSLLLALPASARGLPQQFVGFPLRSLVPLLVLGLLGVLVCLALPKRITIVAFAVWFSIMNSWVAPSARVYGVGTSGLRRDTLSIFKDMDQYTSQLDATLDGIEYWFTQETMDTRQGPVDLGRLFNSYVSTRLWYGNLLTHEGPGRPIEQLTPEHLIGVTCVGVLSSVEAHEALRTQFFKHFEHTERRLQTVAERQFQRGSLELALTVYRVAPTPHGGSGETASAPCTP